MEAEADFTTLRANLQSTQTQQASSNAWILSSLVSSGQSGGFQVGVPGPDVRRWPLGWKNL